MQASQAIDADDVVRAVAGDLGGDIPAALNGPLEMASERGVTLTESLAIAGFLVQCAQFATQVWRAKEDRALLLEALAGNDVLMGGVPSLDAEKKFGLTARILRKMLPLEFEGWVDRRLASATADKTAWIEGYKAHLGGGTAGKREFIGGATVLMPFAGQDWWIVYQNVGWLPDEDDGPGVVRVDVPRGFVTDLASVPPYLWAALRKTGKYGNAAIYHDWLYWMQDSPRAVADKVFERTMDEMGVDPSVRRVMWAAVRIFGGSYWDENARLKADGERRVLKVFPDRPTVSWEEWKLRSDVFA